MKTKIEIYVPACDDCEQHGMDGSEQRGMNKEDITTCIGCGSSLCYSCAQKRGDKHSMSVHNKYGCDSFRKFHDFKYDRETINFCLECMIDPTKHKVANLLKLCLKKDELYCANEKTQQKYNDEMEKIKDKIYNKTLSLECAANNDKYWEAKDYHTNLVTGVLVEN